MPSTHPFNPFMPHSILRRYTPPTCTLEIMAKNSPLSRWAGQPVLQHLRFQLSLDDPKLLKEQWLTLRGDRAQLEALHEAVSTYVQRFLEQSHNLDTFRSHSPEGLASAAEAIAVLPTPAPHKTLSTATASDAISLQASGLLTHKLALGTLATAETPAVSLSTLQLFDLANALDDYASEMLVLPELQRSRHSMPSFLHWRQLAATSLIVIGLSATVVKIIDSSRKPASSTADQGASSTDQIAMQPPPISSGQTLPPPPPPGSTAPPTGLPFPLASPLPGSPSVRNPVGAVTLPNSSTRSLNQQAGKIAIVPSGSSVVRSQSVPPMPKPLALNRELAGVPPSESTSATTARSSGSDSTQAAQMDTAFDTIPQIAEARQYFQQRWKPPQGLTQTLEYTLLVGADGSIQRPVPLGQAAGDYVDRTGIPLVGESFVSPISGGRNAKIRLVLSPDGSVKTFLEGFY